MLNRLGHAGAPRPLFLYLTQPPPCQKELQQSLLPITFSQNVISAHRPPIRFIGTSPGVSCEHWTLSGSDHASWPLFVLAGFLSCSLAFPGSQCASFPGPCRFPAAAPPDPEAGTPRHQARPLLGCPGADNEELTPKDKAEPACATAQAFKEAATAQTRRRPYAPAASGARPAPRVRASLFRVSMVPTSTARHSSRDFGGAAMARS